MTFKLREGVVWSDGTPVTAEDVRWTWQAQTDPDVAWGYAETKEAIEEVEVLDRRTVRFHLREHGPSPLFRVNEGAVLPRHAWSDLPFSEWRADSGRFLERNVSNGPFRLERWEPGQEIVLVRNERYYVEDRPRLEKVVLRIVPDKSQQIQQLIGGVVDYVEWVPPDQAVRLREEDGVALSTFSARQYDFLCWNTLNPLFAERAVRQALTQAIDRQTIVDSLYRGFARVSVSPILSSTWAFHGGLDPWPYDPDAARSLLSSSGFEDGDGDGTLERDGQRFSFELLVNAGSRLQANVATMIQEQLARVGVEARLRALEFNTYVQRITSHDFDASLGGWSIDTSLNLAYAFHSDSIDNGYNLGSYSEPEVDRLIEESVRVTDLEARRRILYRLQEILHEDQPYTFLLEPQKVNAQTARLRDSRPNALSSFYNLPEWWLD